MVEPNPVPTELAQPTHSPVPAPSGEPLPVEASSPTPTLTHPPVPAVTDHSCPLTAAQMESVLGVPVETESVQEYGNNDGRMCTYEDDAFVLVNVYTLPAGGSDATHARAGHLARYPSDQTLEVPGATDVILFGSPTQVHMVVDASYIVVEMLVADPEGTLASDIAFAVAHELTR